MQHTHPRTAHHTHRTHPAARRQVALNQLALAPVVLAVVFAWNLALTGQADGILAKIRRDFVPSMLDGGLVGVGLAHWHAHTHTHARAHTHTT